MTKRQEDHYITREEFIEFCTNSNSKQDCLISQFNLFEEYSNRRYFSYRNHLRAIEH
ncbi:hypothetical protein Q7M25_05385 (plasmid) [Candidatus Liberibacter asiaticus]